MIIHRSYPSTQYTVIPNATLRDPKLSYEARGVLVELLSRPDDWSANADSLADIARSQRGEIGEGRRRIRAAFASLEAAGYLWRVRLRTKRGHMVTEIHVYDTPQTDDTRSGTSVRPAQISVSAGRTDVPDVRYVGGDGTDDTARGTSVPPAQTSVSADRTDVPLTDASVSGTSIGSKENEVTEVPLSPRPGSLHAALNAVVPGVTERETKLALKEIKSRPGVRSAVAVLRTEIQNGGAPDLIAKIRRDEAVTTTSGLPPLCGECDNRWIYDEQERPMHCPRCHPGAQTRQREPQTI